MKYFSILFSLIFTAAAVSAQDKEVVFMERADAALDSYESYALGSSFINIEDNQWYSFGTLNSKMVQNAIVHEFDTYGYDMKEEKADIVVNYLIFDNEYNEKHGYAKQAYIIDQEIGEENVLEQLEEGSLVLSVVDTESGKAVWTGYISDAVDPEGSLREQQVDIRKAVSNVLEVYMGTANFDEYGK